MVGGSNSRVGGSNRVDGSNSRVAGSNSRVGGSSQPIEYALITCVLHSTPNIILQSSFVRVFLEEGIHVAAYSLRSLHLSCCL